MTITERIRPRQLFLEERISLARRMLNEGSTDFGESMSLQMRKEFYQYIRDIMTVLEGDPFGNIREKLDE